MHNGDRYLVNIEFIHAVNYLLADEFLLLLRKLGKSPVSRFPYGIYDLLDIKCLPGPVLLDHPYVALRHISLGIILSFFLYFFCSHDSLRPKSICCAKDHIHLNILCTITTIPIHET